VSRKNILLRRKFFSLRVNLYTGVEEVGGWEQEERRKRQSNEKETRR
jgi:hypothetical protein